MEGESLLRPFRQDRPRNCATLRVPFDFCSCQLAQVERTGAEPGLAGRIGRWMVARMNAAIEQHNLTQLCAPLQLLRSFPVQLTEFGAEQKLGAFKVSFKVGAAAWGGVMVRVQVWPGQGHLWGFVQVQGARNSSTVSFSAISERWARLDEYGKQAFCTDHPDVSSGCRLDLIMFR